MTTCTLPWISMVWVRNKQRFPLSLLVSMASYSQWFHWARPCQLSLRKENIPQRRGPRWLQDVPRSPRLRTPTPSLNKPDTVTLCEMVRTECISLSLNIEMKLLLYDCREQKKLYPNLMLDHSCTQTQFVFLIWSLELIVVLQVTKSGVVGCYCQDINNYGKL